MGKAYEYMAMGTAERRAAGSTEAAGVMSRRLPSALSWHLNSIEWERGMQCYDDFIVYAQNGTDYGCNCYQDLVASVPGQKLELLRSRGFLGQGRRYSTVHAGSEERPPRVYVNSYVLHGDEINANKYVEKVRLLCPSVRSAELLLKGDGMLVVTLSHHVWVTTSQICLIVWQ